MGSLLLLILSLLFINGSAVVECIFVEGKRMFHSGYGCLVKEE